MFSIDQSSWLTKSLSTSQTNRWQKRAGNIWSESKPWSMVLTRKRRSLQFKATISLSRFSATVSCWWVLCLRRTVTPQAVIACSAITSDWKRKTNLPNSSAQFKSQKSWIMNHRCSTFLLKTRRVAMSCKMQTLMSFMTRVDSSRASQPQTCS